MGKSPGKWIKAVLFGKKSSRSNQPKAAKVEKKATTEAAVGDFDVGPPVISDASYQTADRVGDTVEAERSLPCESEPTKLGVDLLDAIGLNPADNAEREKFEQAATKAQAAFRGYLARRAFRALKGIIRLQALIRGHLVRRQAVATLRCMQSIVKFQALARGRRVRLSNPDLQLPKNHKLQEILDSTHVNLLRVNTTSRSEKLAANAFANKLLASLPTALPLSLQYDMDEPNAAWNWLDRWSLLRFWEPLVPPRKISDAKSQVKQANRQSVEAEPGKSRRTFRKTATVANGDNNTPSSLEAEKPRRNSRKSVNHQAEVQPEQPQNELERIKRNLRKVSASATSVPEKSEAEVEKQQNARKASTTIVPEKSEIEVEKPQQNARKASTTYVPEKLEVEVEKPQQNARKGPTTTTSYVSESVTAKPSEQPSDLAVDKVDETEASSESLIIDEPVYVSSPAVEPHSLENDVKVEINASVDEELSTKEDQTGKENQKTRRRKSLPTKQEYSENVSQNTTSLPSYMAATESAKAKLRAQGADKLSDDGGENGYVRRHSLPSSTNGKLSSLSPRLQKPAQANGKGGSKTNKALSASRDDKGLQPGWRR